MHIKYLLRSRSKYFKHGEIYTTWNLGNPKENILEIGNQPSENLFLERERVGLWSIMQEYSYIHTF